MKRIVYCAMSAMLLAAFACSAGCAEQEKTPVVEIPEGYTRENGENMFWENEDTVKNGTVVPNVGIRIYNYAPSIFEEDENTRHAYYCSNKYTVGNDPQKGSINADGNAQITDYIAYRKGVKLEDGNWYWSEKSYIRFFTPIPIAVLQFHALAVRDIVGNLRVSVRVDAPLLRIVAHRIFVGTIIGVAGILVFFENTRRIVVNAYAYVRHNRTVFYGILVFPKHIFAVFPRISLGNFNYGCFFLFRAPRRTSERRQKHRAHRAIYNSFHNTSSRNLRNLFGIFHKVFANIADAVEVYVLALGAKRALAVVANAVAVQVPTEMR